MNDAFDPTFGELSFSQKIGIRCQRLSIRELEKNKYLI